MVPGDTWARRNEQVFSGWSDHRVAGMEARHRPAVAWFLQLLDRAWHDSARGCMPWRLLDIGCGSGHLLRAVADHLVDTRAQPAELVGVDIAKPMIVRALAAASINTSKHCFRFVHGDFIDLAGTLGTFDMVTSLESLYYLPDMVAALAKVRGLLVPGGVFILVMEDDMIATGNPGKDAARLHELAREINVDTVHFMTIDAYISAFQTAGFDHPRVDRRNGFSYLIATHGNDDG